MSSYPANIRNWEERKRKRYEEECRYLQNLFPSMKGEIITIEGVIIKIDASEYGGSDYKKKMGVNFLEENTLILGDDDNNVFLIFRKEEGKVVTTKDITDNIHVIDSCNFDSESIIHSRHVPAKVPTHLSAHLTIVNVNIWHSNIVDDFNNLKISPDGKENFFKKNYKPGGICSLKKMRNHPEWRDEYEDKLETQ